MAAPFLWVVLLTTAPAYCRRCSPPAGTPRPQLSSCFLVCSKNDSIEGIYDSLKECAVISKSAGGIGISIHNIRATGSYIRGTNGTSNGIVPMLRVFNDTARYVDQVRCCLVAAAAVFCLTCVLGTQLTLPCWLRQLPLWKPLSATQRRVDNLPSAGRNWIGSTQPVATASRKCMLNDPCALFLQAAISASCVIT
jgi:hypothetical protein